MLKVMPIQKKHLKDFRELIDGIAKERKYLLILKAPSLKKLSEIVDQTKRNNGITAVALDSEKVIGWANIRSYGHSTTNHVGILGMGVHSGFRGTGIGAKLLKWILTRAKAKKFEIIQLEVFATNRSALRFYKKLGFKVEGVKKNVRKYKGKYDDLVLMAKPV
jgi:ribosomal protein S18 acetylase RimI-like enzyme